MRSNIEWYFLLYFIIASSSHVENESTPEPISISMMTQPIYLGEGPHWDNQSQSLYFVDILRQNIHRLDYKTGDLTFAHMKYGPVGAVVPVQNDSSRLLVACGKDILLVTWDGRQNITDPPFKKLGSLEAAHKDVRVNDGKCDESGRFFIGTMANERGGVIAPKQGSLYNFNGNSKLMQILKSVSISNGLAWNSRSDIFYFIDSETKKVVSYDYDLENGYISNPKVVFDFQKHNITGVPDGMTIDTKDNLWVAAHDAYSILNVNPRDGSLLRVIEMPARRVTSVVFGGPGLDVLFVTSAYQGVNNTERKQKPHSGRVFAVKGLGVTGRLANNFSLKK